MTLALTTLRSRLADAEERAFRAERSAKRARAALRETRLDRDAAREGHAQLSRVLRRLAACQLGDGATRNEVHALFDRWIGEDRKRRAQVDDAALARTLGRLFGQLRGEDDHG